MPISPKVLGQPEPHMAHLPAALFGVGSPIAGWNLWEQGWVLCRAIHSAPQLLAEGRHGGRGVKPVGALSLDRAVTKSFLHLREAVSQTLHTTTSNGSSEQPRFGFTILF